MRLVNYEFEKKGAEIAIAFQFEVLDFTWNNVSIQLKISVRLIIIWARIWTGHLLNTKYDCQSVDCHVNFMYLNDHV
jgi:hypothetical protein